MRIWNCSVLTKSFWGGLGGGRRCPRGLCLPYVVGSRSLSICMYPTTNKWNRIREKMLMFTKARFKTEIKSFRKRIVKIPRLGIPRFGPRLGTLRIRGSRTELDVFTRTRQPLAASNLRLSL